MNNKIDLDKSPYYLQMDIDPVLSLRIFERMDMGRDFSSRRNWPSKDYLKFLNGSHLLLIVNDKVLNTSGNNAERQMQLDALGVGMPERNIPVYKMSDIRTHFQEIDDNSYACYFLEAGKDKLVLEKIKSLGFDNFHGMENCREKKKNAFLVIKNDVYACGDLGGGDLNKEKLQDQEIINGLKSIGISQIQDIPRYNLNEFLEREKKDIAFTDHFFLANIPIDRRTDAVCMKALDKHILNIKDIPHYLLTDERIERILDKNYLHIGDIPKEKLTEERCLNAIKRETASFFHLPEEAKSEKVCRHMNRQGKRLMTLFI